MILFVISWIALVLTGIKFCNFVSDTAFNKENSIALRGICSIEIMLGQYSYEIYLFHPVMIKILRPWIENNIAYTASVIGVTILVSFIYRKCANILNHFVKTGIDKMVFE